MTATRGERHRGKNATETRTADGASLSMKCVAAQARRAAAVSLVVMK